MKPIRKIKLGKTGAVRPLRKIIHMKDGEWTESYGRQEKAVTWTELFGQK
jgi:hypothetical protein